MQGSYIARRRRLFLHELILDRITQFVEDQGSVLFYKNARGLAAARPVFADIASSDSGIEIDR